MNEQGDLFDQPPTGKVRHDHPTTAVDAALAIAPKLKGRRLEVLAAIGRYGPVTDDDLFDLLDYIPQNTVRPRRVELVKDYDPPLVEDSGVRGRTHAGLDAIAWVITAAGRAALAGEALA